MLDEKISAKMAQIYKILSDDTRLQIISLLMEKALRVNDICMILSLKQSTVSHQLAKLRDNRIVDYYSKGNNKYYFLIDEHIKVIFKYCYEHVLE